MALGADRRGGAAVSGVDEVAGRYRTVRLGSHTARVLLAKNPAGWQEALSMVDKHGAGVVIAVNGQVPDGEDLSWLGCRFEHFEDTAWWPRANAAPTWRCGWGMRVSTTRWCTTPWRPSRPARRVMSR